jgi:hypothetical protein
VASLARTVIVALEPRALKDGLTLACETPSGELVVLGERGRLEQVLFNLVDNALKYTRQGGVTVHVNARQGQRRLVVEDTGPAFRARRSGGSSSGSTGSTRRARPRCAGRAGAFDRAAHRRAAPRAGRGRNRPGGGARFTVRLPLAA